MSSTTTIPPPSHQHPKSSLTYKPHADFPFGIQAGNIVSKAEPLHPPTSCPSMA
ncbi:predicted protein [Sclerotinia sclerotiorum 1980 UF-70]|uniref:Uncharacterized protein n=1 Tax=Sclerotinia sclerotiorum (strain ATCC 18683 / 1980 / Ss-1) TaxID=665079 RepID=A7E4E3_SCLS1|nr:predicted protein [Sclerotinia sclerotiorum 1980 UF-70]EDN90765.1 predicted protein [Sclerotinia sclerotiorum 1980 UF-70]